MSEAGLRAGLRQLDELSLEGVVRQRALTLQGIPARLRGTVRFALRAGLDLATRSAPAEAIRGWKLFMLARDLRCPVPAWRT